MAEYESNGSLTTDKRTINDSDGWDSQSEWEAYQSAQNVEIVNGSVQLASSIPDSAISHYDWSDATSTTSITDQTQNGYDLSGSFTSLNEAINGKQAGEFDGQNDGLTVAFSSISQPITVFVVSQYAGPVDGDTHALFDSETTDAFVVQVDNSSDDLVYAGASLRGGVSTTDPALHTIVFDGANSEIRRNGTTQATGDAGSGSLNGITVGANRSGDFSFDGAIGLVEPHDGLPSNGLQTRESEIANKWGITI